MLGVRANSKVTASFAFISIHNNILDNHRETFPVGVYKVILMFEDSMPCFDSDKYICIDVMYYTCSQ